MSGERRLVGGVRPLSENKPAKPFTLAKSDGRINDKDNVQRTPPPPRTVFLPHPQLAPPGMAGTRIARDAAKWMEGKKAPSPDQGEARRFKPLARAPDKDWTPHR